MGHRGPVIGIVAGVAQVRSTGTDEPAADEALACNSLLGIKRPSLVAGRVDRWIGAKFGLEMIQ